jgi:hypothetical protein
MSKPNPVRLQKYLGGVDYPAGKEQLIRKAEENGADGQVVDLLRRLPERTYDGPSGVSKALTAMA